MAYITWLLIGIGVALLVGAATPRHTGSSARSTRLVASAFGGLVGGVIGDGLPYARGIYFNLSSIIGATLGALLFCLALREQASDLDE